MSGNVGTITVGQKLMLPMVDNSPRSALIEEAGAADPFTMFFEPTLSHHHDWSQSVAGWLADSTPLAYEFRTARRFRLHQVQPVSAEAVAAEALSSDRVALLARKYAAGSEPSQENAARLLIVTERLRKLFPAVTEQDMNSLEQLMLEITDVAATDKEIRAELPPAD